MLLQVNALELMELLGGADAACPGCSAYTQRPSLSRSRGKHQTLIPIHSSLQTQAVALNPSSALPL